MPTKHKLPSKVAYSLIRFADSENISSDRRQRLLRASEGYANAHGMTLERTGWRDVSSMDSHGRQAGDPTVEFLRAIDHGLIVPGSTLLAESLEGVISRHPRELCVSVLKIIKQGLTVVTLSDKASYDNTTITANPVGLLASLISMCEAQHATDVRRMIALQSLKQIGV